MERLWAPWRMEYILEEKPAGCIFCQGRDRADDRKSLILHRTACSLVMMNRYPYVNGHLMVAPRQHTGSLHDLSSEELLDIMETTRLCQAVLTADMNPAGFNIGLNLGSAAGAGIADHLHVHIVPRWQGDTNFMTVVGDVRVLPEALTAQYGRLVPRFTSMRREA
jgi:ATP adenylyltransferase